MNPLIPYEKTVVIPIGLDCRDPEHNGLIPVYSRGIERTVFEEVLVNLAKKTLDDIEGSK